MATSTARITSTSATCLADPRRGSSSRAIHANRWRGGGGGGGIEPLIRPYYEALNPQVDAILSGLPAAVAYEQANRRSGDARILWDSFGTGMVGVALALILGGVYGAASFLLRLTPGAGEE